MAGKKRCIRCDRPIDSFAKICPFCNWDQSDLAVPRVEQQTEPTYVPPPDVPWRKYALMAGGGIFILIAAFALGSIMQGHKPPVRGLEQQNQQQAQKTNAAAANTGPRSNVTLVETTNSSDTVAVDQPITSAPVPTPAQGVPAEYQRSDATAVSSVEYAQLAARAQAEKKAKQAVVDPRSLTGPAYAQGPPERSQPQMSSSAEAPPVRPTESTPEPATDTQPERERPRAASTRPVPEYQPIPDIQVSETTTARLLLTVGADGHVKEVSVLQGVPGQTSKIISTVQTWRFRPATENGTPVSAPFSVDLSFRGQ